MYRGVFMARGAMPTIILAAAGVIAAPAAAQTPPTPQALADEVARLRAEVEALKAELRAMRPQAAAPSPVVEVAPPAPAPQLAAKDKSDPKPPQVAFKGAPEFKGEDGWSFKPRGRLQIDGGYLDAPASRVSGQSDGRGFTSRVRRAHFGMQGTMPGGFGYKAEINLANNVATWNDVYITYDNGPYNITIGQQHNFTSMEQLESDLFLTFNERASFINAFNMERRVGISGGYHTGAIMLNAGVFTDDIGDLTNDGNKSVSYDGRIVWMPMLGATQLHFGGSVHYRDLGSFEASLGTRYRARPYIGSTDIRYVDTGVLTVDHETSYGAEFIAIRKRLHLSGEAAWLIADRPGNADPTFFGGYAEAGFFLTNDTRGYKGGMFDRIVPTDPVNKGGIGAIEINVRYDHLDLTDAGIGGGRQDGYGVAVIWTPMSYLRFMVNYMHLLYDIPSQQPKFNAEVVGMRTQIDF